MGSNRKPTAAGRPSKFSINAPQSASLKGGLTVSTTTDPYRRKKRDAARGQDGQATKAGVLHASTPPHGSTVTQNADGTLNYEQSSGTSIFDPVLCELVYRWFCPAGGQVIDPFAGGSVRGIVASRLGRRYLGVDLRREQVEANDAQAVRICQAPLPRWLVGDSRDLARLAGGLTADLVFSCPPYGDLEVYSDDPADLSTLNSSEFITSYRAIIAAAVGLLAPDRFACFVVGDLRDAKGFYRGFVSDTARAFEDAGARLYNEAVLVTSVGSLPIRVGRQFTSGRKLGKTHQNVLVFVKGDPRRAVATLGPTEFGDVAADAAQE